MLLLLPTLKNGNGKKKVHTPATERNFLSPADKYADVDADVQNSTM